MPGIPGAREGLESGGVLTSDTVWFLNGVPKKLGVIGGGAIGMEMAQIFQDCWKAATASSPKWSPKSPRPSPPC